MAERPEMVPVTYPEMFELFRQIEARVDDQHRRTNERLVECFTRLELKFDAHEAADREKFGRHEAANRSVEDRVLKIETARSFEQDLVARRASWIGLLVATVTTAALRIGEAIFFRK